MAESRVVLGALLCIVSLAQCTQGRSFSIDYDHNTFVKDGKPFRYISGSLHYQRVPYQYWDDRLQKMAAAGLNAVQTYVPWNIHEPQPGLYNFKGQNNIVNFLTLAQKNNLLVILRPGPYICAEWEFGGFPAWLINKNPEMLLRTSQPEYIQYVDRWLSKLYGEIKKMTYENGGPIISVQIENEYGSYFACDSNYTGYLVTKAKSMLGQNVVLFTTDGDGDSYVKCGKVDGAYITIDFGVTFNPEKNFEVQRKWQPKGPFVNSEFYVGWLDHWGEKHSTVGTKEAATSLDLILKYGANINMYMFEGGTNFGFWNGANSNPFAPVPTSYDYDAPISEAGDVTDKYHTLRDVISKYNPLPPGDVPPNTPKFAYGTVKLQMFNSIQSYAEKSCSHHNTTVTSQYPLTMEQIQHYYGFILYRHVLTADVEQKVLNISGIRDRGYVTINQKPVGIVDRSGNQSLVVSGARNQHLEILVENLGRINYGSQILNNSKGLISNVTLGGKILMDWIIFPVAFDDEINPPDTSLRYRPRPDVIRRNRKISVSQLSDEGLTNPSFYVGELIVPADPRHPMDTYVDLPSWTKGQFFINGNNVGRYWTARGPQKRLYIPKYFLQRGTNRIVVLETERSPCDNDDDCSVIFKDTPVVNGTITPGPLLRQQQFSNRDMMKSFYYLFTNEH